MVLSEVQNQSQPKEKEDAQTPDVKEEARAPRVGDGKRKKGRVTGGGEGGGAELQRRLQGQQARPRHGPHRHRRGAQGPHSQPHRSSLRHAEAHHAQGSNFHPPRIPPTTLSASRQFQGRQGNAGLGGRRERGQDHARRLHAPRPAQGSPSPSPFPPREGKEAGWAWRRTRRPPRPSSPKPRPPPTPIGRKSRRGRSTARSTHTGLWLGRQGSEMSRCWTREFPMTQRRAFSTQPR